jgi:carbamoyltransferase
LPAITHVDYSARIQTVSRAGNPLLYDLLLRFERATGCGVLVNTSFNVRGEPIVCTPDDAYRCFVNTEMDYLILGNFVIERTAQPRQKIQRRLAPQAD